MPEGIDATPFARIAVARGRQHSLGTAGGIVLARGRQHSLGTEPAALSWSAEKTNVYNSTSYKGKGRDVEGSGRGDKRESGVDEALYRGGSFWDGQGVDIEPKQIFDGLVCVSGCVCACMCVCVEGLITSAIFPKVCQLPASPTECCRGHELTLL